MLHFPSFLVGADLFSKHLLTTWYVQGTGGSNAEGATRKCHVSTGKCLVSSGSTRSSAFMTMWPPKPSQQEKRKKGGKSQAWCQSHSHLIITQSQPNFTKGWKTSGSGWKIWWVTASGRCLYYIPTLLARLSVLPKATPLISKGARISSYCPVLNPYFSHCTVLHWFRSWKFFYCKKFGIIL